MMMKLSHNQQFKIGIILYLFLVVYSFLYTYGNSDAFLPQNIVSFLDFVYYGNGFLSTVIGYHSFGAMICLILGISPDSLLTLPISIIPLSAIVCLILYRISKNIILATILMGCLFCSISTSDYNVYWIHTIGMILYFLIIYLIFMDLENKIGENSYKNSIFICLIIVLLSLNYISYNYMAMVFSLIFCFTAVVLIQFIRVKFYNLDIRYIIPKSHILLLMIISGLMIFELNTYYYIFYNAIGTMNEFGISSIDKFLIYAYQFLGVSESASISPLAPYYFTSTYEIAILQILRFTTCALVIIIYGHWLLKIYLSKNKTIDSIDIILITILLGIIIFILTRIILVVNLGALLMLITPSVLIFARVCTLKQDVKLKKNWAGACDDIYYFDCCVDSIYICN